MKQRGSLNPAVNNAQGGLLANPGPGSQDSVSVQKPELSPGVSYYDEANAQHAGVRPESHPVVREVMREEVLGTLRRTAALTAIVLTLFAAYDYFEWHNNYIVKDISSAGLYRVLGLRLVGVAPSAGAVALTLYFMPLKGPQMQVANMLLVRMACAVSA